MNRQLLFEFEDWESIWPKLPKDWLGFVTNSGPLQAEIFGIRNISRTERPTPTIYHIGSGWRTVGEVQWSALSLKTLSKTDANTISKWIELDGHWSLLAIKPDCKIKVHNSSPFRLIVVGKPIRLIESQEEIQVYP